MTTKRATALLTLAAVLVVLLLAGAVAMAVVR